MKELLDSDTMNDESSSKAVIPQSQQFEDVLLEAKPEYLGDDLLGSIGSKAIHSCFKGFRR